MKCRGLLCECSVLTEVCEGSWGSVSYPDLTAALIDQVNFHFDVSMDNYGF